MRSRLESVPAIEPESSMIASMFLRTTHEAAEALAAAAVSAITAAQTRASPYRPALKESSFGSGRAQPPTLLPPTSRRLDEFLRTADSRQRRFLKPSRR